MWPPPAVKWQGGHVVWANRASVLLPPKNTATTSTASTMRISACVLRCVVYCSHLRHWQSVAWTIFRDYSYVCLYVGKLNSLHTDPVNCMTSWLHYLSFYCPLFCCVFHLSLQVNCLEDTCGLTTFTNSDTPDQFYRLWTSLCIHVGWVSGRSQLAKGGSNGWTLRDWRKWCYTFSAHELPGVWRAATCSNSSKMLWFFHACPTNWPIFSFVFGWLWMMPGAYIRLSSTLWNFHCANLCVFDVVQRHESFWNVQQPLYDL